MFAARGADPTALSVSDGIDAMLAFYRTIPVDDCAAVDGDMLLYQWGRSERGSGPCFDLDITRQFMRNGGEDDDIWQLSLTFVFGPLEIDKGNRWCGAPEDLDELVAFIRSSRAYQVGCASTPVRVELKFERAG